MTVDITPPRLAVLADEIRVEVAAAEADWQSAVQHAITAGARLIEAKSLVNHGEWLPWLEANFDGSERTARNYIRLASNRQRVADLPTIRDALAMLAPPKPDADQQVDLVKEFWPEVVDEHGPKPTAKQARQVVEECLAMADASTEDFEQAINKAREEGDLSRSNVVLALVPDPEERARPAPREPESPSEVQAASDRATTSYPYDPDKLPVPWPPTHSDEWCEPSDAESAIAGLLNSRWELEPVIDALCIAEDNLRRESNCADVFSEIIDLHSAAVLLNDRLKDLCGRLVAKIDSRRLGELAEDKIVYDVPKEGEQR